MAKQRSHDATSSSAETSQTQPRFDDANGTFEEAQAALKQNPLLRDPLWLSQIELATSLQERVLEQHQMLIPGEVVSLFPGWVSDKPEQALTKRAQRNDLIEVTYGKERLYPAVQFDTQRNTLSVRRPVIEGYRTAKKSGISTWGYLHWLGSAQPMRTARKKLEFEQAVAEGDMDTGLAALKTRGPSERISLTPAQLLLSSRVAFSELLNDWLSPAMEASHKLKVEQSRALLSEWGVDPHELIGSEIASA